MELLSALQTCYSFPVGKIQLAIYKIRACIHLQAWCGIAHNLGWEMGETFRLIFRLDQARVNAQSEAELLRKLLCGSTWLHCAAPCISVRGNNQVNCWRSTGKRFWRNCYGRQPRLYTAPLVAGYEGRSGPCFVIRLTVIIDWEGGEAWSKL